MGTAVKYEHIETPEGLVEKSTFFHMNGALHHVQYRLNKELHRMDGPASESFHDDGRLINQMWHQFGKGHRLCGPSFTQISEKSGTTYHYWIRGKHVPKDTLDAFVGLEEGTPEWEFTWEML